MGSAIVSAAASLCGKKDNAGIADLFGNILPRGVARDGGGAEAKIFAKSLTDLFWRIQFPLLKQRGRVANGSLTLGCNFACPHKANIIKQLLIMLLNFMFLLLRSICFPLISKTQNAHSACVP